PDDFARVGFQAFDRAGARVGSIDVMPQENPRADALRVLFVSPDAVGFGDVAASAELEPDGRPVESADSDAEIAVDHGRRIGQVSFLPADPVARPDDLAVLRVVSVYARRERADDLIFAIDFGDDRSRPASHVGPIGAALLAVPVDRLLGRPD